MWTVCMWLCAKLPNGGVFVRFRSDAYGHGVVEQRLEKSKRVNEQGRETRKYALMK